MSTATIEKPAVAKQTITAEMSQWAQSLTFEQLSGDAIHQAKRFLLDSLGCALGGYTQHDVTIALEVLDELDGPGRATIIGSGRRTDVASAALANALMVRCMDYNDIYWQQDPSHPSDLIPAAMACCKLGLMAFITAARTPSSEIIKNKMPEMKTTPRATSHAFA